MSKCQHGTVIHFSWEECPECCEEHDANENAQTAKSSVEEQKKQTAILEQILKNQKELLNQKKG